MNKVPALWSTLHRQMESLSVLFQTNVSDYSLYLGLLEGQDCFNQILCGIDNVIRRHVNEMHSKFESRFSNMAMEVERRDIMIAHLQSKLRNLELNATSRRRGHREKVAGPCTGDDDENDQVGIDEDDSSSGSSAELLFMVRKHSLLVQV